VKVIQDVMTEAMVRVGVEVVSTNRVDYCWHLPLAGTLRDWKFGWRLDRAMTSEPSFPSVLNHTHMYSNPTLRPLYWLLSRSVLQALVKEPQHRQLPCTVWIGSGCAQSCDGDSAGLIMRPRWCEKSLCIVCWKVHGNERASCGTT